MKGKKCGLRVGKDFYKSVSESPMNNVFIRQSTSSVFGSIVARYKKNIRLSDKQSISKKSFRFCSCTMRMSIVRSARLTYTILIFFVLQLWQNGHCTYLRYICSTLMQNKKQRNLFTVGTRYEWQLANKTSLQKIFLFISLFVLELSEFVQESKYQIS